MGVSPRPESGSPARAVDRPRGRPSGGVKAKGGELLAGAHRDKRYTARRSPTDDPSTLAHVDLVGAWSKAVLVELTGFEPVTPSLRTKCATGLRHSPKCESNSNRYDGCSSRAGTA